MSDPRLPLFPLTLVLLPGEPVPLHIFEPRYQDLVRVCLDEDRPFGIVHATATGVAEVGCTARIRRVVQRYDDGRLDIVVVGEERFRVVDVSRDHSYLCADTEPVDDADPAESRSARERVIARHMKLLEYAGEPVQPGLYDADVPVSFVVGRRAGLELDGRQRLLDLRSEAERLAFLSDHLGEMLRRVRRARDVQERSRGDGHAGPPPDPGPPPA